MAIVSRGGDKAFLDIMGSHVQWATWLGWWDTLTLNHEGWIVRAIELNNKNIYVLQIGASLCYKLEQLCFITN